jgi:hypothetical protein
VSVLDRNVERRVAVVVFDVYIGAVPDEDPGKLQIAVARGLVKRPNRLLRRRNSQTLG